MAKRLLMAHSQQDISLKPGDVFSDDLVANVRDSTLLLLLLSQNYIDSEWCGKELHHFIRTCANAPDKPAKVFVVDLFPFETFSGVPDNIRNIRKDNISAVFWYRKADVSALLLAGNPTPRESGPESERHYWLKLHELGTRLTRDPRPPQTVHRIDRHIGSRAIDRRPAAPDCHASLPC
jgi:hypothetical protein